MPYDVVVLGCGYTGAAVARLALAKGMTVTGFVRSAERAAKLAEDGIVVSTAPLDEDSLSVVTESSHVVVAFPPDGSTDARIAPLLARAMSIAYVSSTAVYGDTRGVIDDETPLPMPSARARKVLDAEDAYRAAHGVIFRCPAIYGADRGLHMRIARGEHRIPGDGSAYTSRIHVEDLAQILIAARGRADDMFVVGDARPATHIEIASWISKEWAVPMPAHVPVEQVHETLRGDRQVDGTRALSTIGVTLRYPDYRAGMLRPP